MSALQDDFASERFYVEGYPAILSEENLSN